MTKAGIAILGCEQSVAMYMPMFRYLNNGKFIAAVDIVEEKAEKARDVYGARRAYTSIDEMLLDADIDGVIVATPHYLHGRGMWSRLPKRASMYSARNRWRGQSMNATA